MGFVHSSTIWRKLPPPSQENCKVLYVRLSSLTVPPCQAESLTYFGFRILPIYFAVLLAPLPRAAYSPSGVFMRNSRTERIKAPIAVSTTAAISSVSTQVLTRGAVARSIAHNFVSAGFNKRTTSTRK